MTIVNIQDTAPCDCSRVNVQTSKAASFLFGQIIWVSFGNSKLFQSTEHDRFELAFASFGGYKTGIEGFVALGSFMKHTRLKGSCKEVVRSCDGVNVSCQVQVEFVHGNDLAIST